jgi:hypothetical protein
MKRLFIAALLILSSCEPAVKDATKPIKDSGHEETYNVVNIDGCQYIIFYGWYSNSNTMIVHKGNCNNPIHNK